MAAFGSIVEVLTFLIIFLCIYLIISRICNAVEKCSFNRLLGQFLESCIKSDKSSSEIAREVNDLSKEIEY